MENLATDPAAASCVKEHYRRACEMMLEDGNHDGARRAATAYGLLVDVGMMNDAYDAASEGGGAFPTASVEKQKEYLVAMEMGVRTGNLRMAEAAKCRFYISLGLPPTEDGTESAAAGDSTPSADRQGRRTTPDPSLSAAVRTPPGGGDKLTTASGGLNGVFAASAGDGSTASVTHQPDPPRRSPRLSSRAGGATITRENGRNGFQAASFPTTEEGTARSASINGTVPHHMERTGGVTSEHQPRLNANPVIVLDVQPNDVLLSGGGKVHSNAAYKELLRASINMNRIGGANAIIPPRATIYRQVQEAGGRFLKPDKMGHWVEGSREHALKKIGDDSWMLRKTLRGRVESSSVVRKKPPRSKASVFKAQIDAWNATGFHDRDLSRCYFYGRYAPRVSDELLGRSANRELEKIIENSVALSGVTADPTLHVLDRIRERQIFFLRWNDTTSLWERPTPKQSRFCVRQRVKQATPKTFPSKKIIGPEGKGFEIASSQTKTATEVVPPRKIDGVEDGEAHEVFKCKREDSDSELSNCDDDNSEDYDF
jgi:hypothetical protein